MIIEFIAALLVTACFASVLLLGRIAERYRRERNAWLAAVCYLHENPGDTANALKVASQTKGGDQALNAAATLLLNQHET